MGKFRETWAHSLRRTWAGVELLQEMDQAGISAAQKNRFSREQVQELVLGNERLERDWLVTRVYDPVLSGGKDQV